MRLDGAIPAVPLLLGPDGGVDWRAQTALLRYYLAAGVSGLAVGVHTTQFELHDHPALLSELWGLAASVVAGHDVTLVAGVVGGAQRAVAEAETAAGLGFDAALLCSYAMTEVTEATLLAKAAAVGEVLPTIGFYLQEAVGGRRLSPTFWQRLCDQPTLVAIKAAPFDRYRTRDVAQAILASDRWRDVRLLTGNDDAIVWDLVTPHTRTVAGEERSLRAVGGLLGQFAVGTRAAVRLTAAALAVDGQVPATLLSAGADLVEVNAAVFDVAHGFAGCVPGVNEVLRQQGLAATAGCLSPAERLSPGQAELIADVRARFAELLDEDFVAAHRDTWLG